MASDKIFVDLDEEIVFTVEKILSASSDRVIVVIPESANLVASLVSLKLLSSQVAKSKKTIVSVTEDHLGLKLSKQAGILTKEKISEITPNVWVEAEELKKSYLDKRKKVRDELIARRNESTDYKITDEQEKFHPEKSNLKDSKDLRIGPKDEKESSLAEEKNNEKKAKDYDYVPGLKDKPRLDPKVVNLGNIKVLAGGDIEVNPDFQDKILGVEKQNGQERSLGGRSQEKDKGVRSPNPSSGSPRGDSVEPGQAPRPERKDNRDNVIETKDAQEKSPGGRSQDVKPSQAPMIIGRDMSAFIKASRGSRRSAPAMTDNQSKQAGSSLMERLKINFQNLKTRIIAFYQTGNTKAKIAATVGILIVLLYFITSMFLVSAEVTIYAKRQNIEVNETVTGEEGVDIDAENLIIPVRAIKVRDSSSNSADSTGQVEDGVKAKGLITIYNKIEQEVNIPAGSVVENISSGLKYAITSAVTVPAAVVDGEGNTNLGVKKDVSIEAASFGSQYNTNGTASYKVASYTTDEVSAKSFSNIEGGDTSDERAVSAEDIADLENGLIDELKNRLTQELSDLVAKDEERLLEGTVTYTTVSSSSDKQAKEKADSFTVTVELEATAYVVKLDDLKELISVLIQQSSEFDGEVNKDQMEDLETSNIQVVEGKVTFDISSTGDITAGVSKEQLAQDLAKLSKSEAEKKLKEINGIEDYKINIKPFFLPSFIKNMPSKEKINVRILDAK